MVRQLIYTSRVTPGLRHEDALLRSILEASVRNNGAVAVTGMLLRHRDHFIQALEGSAAAVETIYGRVRQDSRHQDIKLLQDTAGEGRSFAGWAMCGANMGPADNEILEILNLRRELDPRQISGSSALSLLKNVHTIQRRVLSVASSPVVIDA